MRMTWMKALLLAAAVWLPSSAACSDDALAGALTRQLESNRARYGIAGQALLVARDGKVLFRGVDGEADIATHAPVTPDHAFAGYSLAKLFASVLVMQLVEQGRLDLDDPASAYLDGLPARWQAIAVRDFLDHTSGVPEYFDGAQADPAAIEAMLPATRETAFAALAEQPLQFAPGTDVRYTQTNYLVLAALLTARYGMPYQQLVDERILRPLHLRATWLGPAMQARAATVTRHAGVDGRLQAAPDIRWPAYAAGHAGLYASLDDLGIFLQALASGALVGRDTLQALWQSRTLVNGRRGWFAGGWELETSDGRRQVGHDGGTQVRVRIVFDAPSGRDAWIIAYLTNGSARNVWSRTLVDGVMAQIAPERFPVEALNETLQAFALGAPEDGDAEAQAAAIHATTTLDDAALERAVNSAGYGIRENFGVDPALRVFALNTVLFPASANAWDSLAETHALAGDAALAQQLYARARALAAPAAPAAQQ